MWKYNIKWSIVEKVHWKTKIDHCSQCLAEKLHLIEYFNDTPLWNKGGEFINDCKHPNKPLLKSLKRNDSTDFH